MSLRGDKYETVDEVKTRLEGTVVLYDGQPVYITTVSYPEAEPGEIARVYFVPLPYAPARNPRQPTRKFLSSKKFDLTPPKMGYFNTGTGQAVFVSRNPIRQYKQGLLAANCVMTDVRGKGAAGVNFAGMIAMQGFVDMINGKYPSFDEVGDLIDNKENASVAVSRSFAFHIDHDLEALLLMHRGVKCGICLKGEKQMRLPPKFHFLKQEAEACRIPLA